MRLLRGSAKALACLRASVREGFRPSSQGVTIEHEGTVTIEYQTEVSFVVVVNLGAGSDGFSKMNRKTPKIYFERSFAKPTIAKYSPR